MNTIIKNDGRRTTGKAALKLLSLALLSLWLVPMLALAQTTPPAGQTQTPTKGLSGAVAQNDTFGSLAGIKTNANVTPAVIAGNIIYAMLGLLGIIFVVLTIYAGFLWMTAQGNEEQISKAKKMLVNAVIGLVIIMAAWSITAFVLYNLSSAMQAGPKVTPTNP